MRWGGKEARKEEGGSEAAAKGRKEASKAGWETEQDQEAEEGKKDNRQGRRPVRGRREVRKQAKEKKKELEIKGKTKFKRVGNKAMEKTKGEKRERQGIAA